MRLKRKAIINVRKVGDEFVYYIQEGNKKVNFSLPQHLHDELKQAQFAAELIFQKQQDDHAPIVLQLAEDDQKSRAV